MPEDNNSPCRMTAFFISSFAVLAHSAFNSLKCVVYNHKTSAWFRWMKGLAHSIVHCFKLHSSGSASGSDGPFDEIVIDLFHIPERV
jgi:hypothetical protein